MREPTEESVHTSWVAFAKDAWCRRALSRMMQQLGASLVGEGEPSLGASKATLDPPQPSQGALTDLLVPWTAVPLRTPILHCHTPFFEAAIPCDSRSLKTNDFYVQYLHNPLPECHPSPHASSIKGARISGRPAIGECQHHEPPPPLPLLSYGATVVMGITPPCRQPLDFGEAVRGGGDDDHHLRGAEGGRGVRGRGGPRGSKPVPQSPIFRRASINCDSFHMCSEVRRF